MPIEAVQFLKKISLITPYTMTVLSLSLMQTILKLNVAISIFSLEIVFNTPMTTKFYISAEQILYSHLTHSAEKLEKSNRLPSTLSLTIPEIIILYLEV